MVHGRFLRRGFTYQVGVFEDDGDNGRLQEPQFVPSGDIPGLGPSFAARVTATPLRPLAETFENLRVGFAYGRSTCRKDSIACADKPSMEPTTSSNPSM